MSQKYNHVVEAQQYTGDIKAIKKFLGVKDADFDDSTKDLFVVQDEANPNVRFKAVPGDYIVKGAEGFLVYKEERFLKEYSLVE